MGSPMPKISWKCKKKIVITESSCDSDETYFDGSSPRNITVKETVPNVTMTSNDLSQEPCQSLKLNSAINVKSTSSAGTHISNTNLSISQSTRQEKLSTGSGCSRRLTWKEPIASYSQERIKRLSKQFCQDSVVSKLNDLHDKLTRMNGKLNRSLLAGGRPLTYEKAERMLHKTQHCLEQLTTLPCSVLVMNARLSANQIVKRLTKKMTDVNKEGSGCQHRTGNSTNSENNISPLENSSQPQTADSFETQPSLSQTTLQNGQELVWKDESQTQTQSQTQLTTDGLTHSNMHFANQAQTTDQSQTDLRNNSEKQTQPRELGCSPSLLLPASAIGNVKHQNNVTQANASELKILAQVNGEAAERYSRSQNDSQTQATMSPSLSATDGQTQQHHLVQTATAMQVDTLMEGETDLFQESSDMYSSCDLQLQVGPREEGAGDETRVPSGKLGEETQDCNGIMFLSCVTEEVTSDSKEYDGFQNGTDMDQGSFQESLSAVPETEARRSNAEGREMPSSGRIEESLRGEKEAQATLSEENFSQDYIEDTQPMNFKSFRTPKRKGKRFREVETANSLLPKAISSRKEMGNIVMSNRKTTTPTTSEDKIERSISEVLKNVNRLPSKSQTSTSKTFSSRDQIPNDVKFYEDVEILGGSVSKQCQAGKNTSQGDSALVQDSSRAEKDLPGSSLPKPSASFHHRQEVNPLPNVKSGKAVCESDSRERFPESVFPRNVGLTECCAPSHRPANDVIVLSSAEKLGDERWRLPETLYERQRRLRGSQPTVEKTVKFTSLDDRYQSPWQMMEQDGNAVLSSQNASNKQSGTKLRANKASDSLLLTPETLVDSLEFPASQLSKTNITENADSTQASTQTLLEFSQDFANTSRSGQKASAVNQKGDRSLTQMMLEDSQEMDIAIDLKKLAEQSPRNLTGNSTLSLNQEPLADNQESGTQSTICCAEPSTRTDSTQNFASSEILTQNILEDSQDMYIQSSEEIIAPSKFSSRLVRSSMKEYNGEVPFACFAPPKSVVLGVPLLKTLSPAAAKWLTSQDGLLKNQALDRNKLTQQNLYQAKKDLPGVSQACSQNSLASIDTDSLRTFKATAKSQQQTFGNDIVLRPCPPNIKASSQEKQNSASKTQFEFVLAQIPDKKGQKRPLQIKCSSTQKSTTTFNSASCFQQIPASNSESMTQLPLQDSQEWSARDFECLDRSTSSTCQAMNRSATLAHSSGVRSRSNVNTFNNRFLTKQLNIQKFPGLTSIDINVTCKPPLKTVPNLEVVNRKDQQNPTEVEVTGLPNLSTTADQYGYFVATRMKDQTAHKRQNMPNSAGNPQGSVGKVSHQNQNPKSSTALHNYVQQQGTSNQPTNRQTLLGNQVEHQRQVSAPLRQLQTQNESQTTKQRVKSVQASVDRARISTPSHVRESPTGKQLDHYDTVDSLILNLFDFKNVMARRTATEGLGVVRVQHVVDASKAAGKLPNPLISRFSSSVLAELLFPKDLGPVRQAERDVILGLTHVRRPTAHDFAPKTSEVAEFLQKPFTWENIPADVLKDLEDSSDEL